VKNGDIHSWLKKPQPIFIGGSLVAAIIAALAEGVGNPTGLLLLCVCVLVICIWTVTGKPSFVWAVAIVTISLVAIGWSGGNPESAIFQAVLLAAAIGWKEANLRTSALLGLVLLSIPVIATIGPFGSDWGWWNWIIGIIYGWVFGRLIRFLAITLDELTMAQEQVIQSAAKEERVRISRDVHDLVGHSLTAMLLNVRAAMQNLDINLVESGKALKDAEKIGVRGLDDIRSAMVGLRGDATAISSDENKLRSLPDYRSIQSLLDNQHHITVRSIGDINRLQGSLAVSVYRILQECITNITKHSSNETGNLTIKVGTGHVEIFSDNKVAPSFKHEPLSGSTLGLIGMRERVSGHGGEFTTRARDGRWQLECRIPIND